MKSVNGVPGSSSTTATSMSLQMKNDSFRRNHNNYHYSNGGLQHTSNGNGLQGPGPPPALGSNVVESSNMLVSMNLPPSGNGRRPAVGRGFSKNCWLSLQPRLFWLLLWGVLLKGTFNFINIFTTPWPRDYFHPWNFPIRNFWFSKLWTILEIFGLIYILLFSFSDLSSINQPKDAEWFV